MFADGMPLCGVFQMNLIDLKIRTMAAAKRSFADFDLRKKCSVDFACGSKFYIIW